MGCPQALYLPGLLRERISSIFRAQRGYSILKDQSDQACPTPAWG